MTFAEAIKAVRENKAGRSSLARTAAKRPGWRRGVILSDDGNDILINDYGSDDPSTWGLDYSATVYIPTDEDESATDWEICELWS